ncbi:MAG: hypothetical protein NTZ19_02085 [Bacteroidetes bacterium]|nr:hypothetical protein [Bacteroidota bacterium]
MLRNSIIYPLLTILLLSLAMPMIVCSQSTENSDSFFLAKKKGIWGKIGKTVSVSSKDQPSIEDGVKKNEASFSKFKGKVIRHIIIQKLNFGGTVNDTSHQTKNFFNDIGNKLHPNTSDRVIKNNLFFSEGDTLYPALVADNERFLRDISYLQDAKILIRNTENTSDRVDVYIVCKDVFPVGGSADLGSEKLLNFEVNDDNFVGTGDRIAFRNMVDLDRTPHYGFRAEYLKRNLMGSFININVGYSNIEPAFNSGRREETALFIKAELPLVSPYSTWTGAYESSIRFTTNNYLSDSLYNSDFKYSYRLHDAWVGYNIGAKKHLSDQIANRRKHLIALRGVYRNFIDIPNLNKTVYNNLYTNLTSVIGSLFIFEQDYYHTNFIYGFGRNEDVPEGFSMSFTGGWTNKNIISRPYIGFDYQRFYFTRKNAYVNYLFRLGTYYGEKQLQDLSVLTGAEYFTKLRRIKGTSWRTRQFLSGSITQLMNTKLNDPLRISGIYGLPEVNDPTIQASTRITGNYESVFYNTWKFFGFSFAPFGFTNISYLRSNGSTFKEGDIYTSVGAGVRTRNENLVFGTMELRAFYYPRAVGTMNVWNIVFNTALRFKYNSQYIAKPDFAVNN